MYDLNKINPRNSISYVIYIINITRYIHKCNIVWYKDWKGEEIENLILAYNCRYTKCVNYYIKQQAI